MVASTVLQVRIDPDLKREAEALFAGLGTSLPEAVRMFAARSVQVGGLPFPVSRTRAAGRLAGDARPGRQKVEEQAMGRALVGKHARSR